MRYDNRSCVECGAQFTPRRRDSVVCTKRCFHRRRDRIRPKRPASKYAGPPCLICSHPVRRRDSAGYCSRKCTGIGKRRSIRAEALERECKVYRSWADRYARGKELDRIAAEKLKMAQSNCGTCGLIFDASEPYSQADKCKPCRKETARRNARARAPLKRKDRRKTERGKAERYLSKVKRRVRSSPVQLSFEVIIPTEVFNRDMWRCYICGIHTPKKQRGSNAATAPEIDHRISLAAGGSHTMSNVSCCCRRCNGLKGKLSIHEFVTLFDVSREKGVPYVYAKPQAA